eukprot:COSAG03_NODE_39_length_17408_cov_16.363972_6_plen_190_part_00
MRLLKNVVRFSFVTLFSKLVLIIGILMTVGGAVWVALFCIHLIYPGPDPNALPGAVPTGPAFLVAFFSYTIANNIMGIYETAIDTILVSFLEDEAENDDKGKMSFAGGDLARFMKGTVCAPTSIDVPSPPVLPLCLSVSLPFLSFCPSGLPLCLSASRTLTGVGGDCASRRGLQERINGREVLQNSLQQ